MIDYRTRYEADRPTREKLKNLLDEISTDGMTEFEVYQELIYSLGYMPRPE